MCPFPHLYTGTDGNTCSWDTHRNKRVEDLVHSKCSINLKACHLRSMSLTPTDHHGSNLLFQTPLTLTSSAALSFIYCTHFVGWEAPPDSRTKVPIVISSVVLAALRDWLSWPLRQWGSLLCLCSAGRKDEKSQREDRVEMVNTNQSWSKAGRESPSQNAHPVQPKPAVPQTYRVFLVLGRWKALSLRSL